MHPENIRDQIIEGLLDGDTVEHLDLTLTTTITMCRAQEAAKQQHKDIADHSVLAIRHPPKQPIRQKLLFTSTSAPKACPGCGLQTHHGGRAQCPAFKQTCRFALRLATLPGSAIADCYNRSLLLPKPSQPQKTQIRTP